jgi:hypothetical protein
LRARIALALAIAALLTQGCTAPAFNESQYRSKVANTAESAVSVIETVRLALDDATRHTLPIAPIDVTVSAQEDIIGAVAGTFSSVQPPTEEMDALRTKVLDLLAEAQTKVETARIELRRGDLDEAFSTIEEAAEVSTELDEIASRY